MLYPLSYEGCEDGILGPGRFPTNSNPRLSGHFAQGRFARTVEAEGEPPDRGHSSAGGSPEPNPTLATLDPQLTLQCKAIGRK